MDSAHVCLVSVSLEAEGFDKFKCERAVSLGVDMDSMSKVMRCAAKDDIISLSAASASPDTLKFTFEAADQERVSEYEMKLMTIEEEHLAIPDTEYTAIVTVSMRDFYSTVSPESCSILLLFLALSPYDEGSFVIPFHQSLCRDILIMTPPLAAAWSGAPEDPA